ncbi:uncharacterized protein Z518_06563 [Rhinocladiella mackenziei CBS 650.93]|uniref:Rhinocladiella mackenziei CBS 650.93 unplaced genomic scaffold supercont1.5, whole genome shotgun sequence n=1 Tax=Rhinocladiella mackenziei CBS 650.93 TaxID=1442369 RepID=A0A0D2GXX9_9EURO|nr:uncharacterized protein Z518_06563 [Rhinocladiella mackenziei CBS 650.93]KIX03013.1 hypothetical protein Z518_06563 [Rhinocladiella mackenziei CBS 650.93]
MGPTAPPPKPRAGQHRRPNYRGRIEGIGSPAPSSLRATTPTVIRASTPSLNRPTGPKTMKCSNPHCPSPNIVESEQGLICDTCGAVAQEESGLVSEQGFGETESGRITALGVHVGESQTHQRTYAPGGALGNAGREPTINRDRSEAQARTVMLSYQSLLGVRPAEVDAGMQIFKLAWSNSFVQGRTIDSVAVVCLYLSCRRKHEQIRNERRPMYSLMLIDFAEKLNIDVFALGKMYSDLVRKLYLQPDGSIQGDVSADLLAMGPEILVSRFVDELEFDREHRDKIKLDAIRIVQRMKRDWMSTGRRPSGVCGAAVILAARMNNYRRTTREVVLTAKVTEITINKRLEEFQDTESSKLSINQFRDNEVLEALAAADPPAYQRARHPKEKRSKRGRPKKNRQPEIAAEIEGDTTTREPQDHQENQEPGPEERPAKRVRIDADGYKIPEIPQRQIPVDPSLTLADLEATTSASGEESPEASPARTRKPRGPNWKAPPASPAELAIEQEIEHDVLETLRENPELDPTHQETSNQPDQTTTTTDGSDPSTPPSPEPSSTEPISTPTLRREKVLGPAVNTTEGNLGNVSLSPTLRPDEFDSDEDVSTCLLSEEETRIKERVWVSMNADWLRQDHAKRIKRELKEAEMRARGLDPADEALKASQAKGKRKDGTKRPGRRGDVSYLNERDGERERGDVEAAGEGEGKAGQAGTTADRERSAAESVRKMFKTRGVYSRRVNYDVLDSIYGVASGDSAESRSVTGTSRSRSQSVASSVAPGHEREGSVAGFVASEGIFRGNGSRDGGRQRNKGSISAEQREKQRKAKQKVGPPSATTPAGQDDEAGRSVSRSRSPLTAEADEGDRDGNQEEDNPTRQRELSGPSPEPQPPPQPPTRQQASPQPVVQTQQSPTVSVTGPGIPTVLATTSTSISTPQTKIAESAKEKGIDAGPSVTASTDDNDTNKDDEDEDGDEDLDDEAEDEDADDDQDQEAEDEDVDAAFEGRYTGRG